MDVFILEQTDLSEIREIESFGITEVQIRRSGSELLTNKVERGLVANVRMCHVL